MSDPIPHSRPVLGSAEEEALLRVVRSGWIAQGPEVAALEREAAPLLGHPDGVAVGSGSQALLLALRCLDLGPGHRVALPAFACAAVLHAVQWSGAEPVLLDNRAGDIAPGPEELDVACPVDGAILVHPWGYPLDPASWLEQVPRLVEDCAGSVGAGWEDRPVGSFGRAAILSFYATKMLCAGEGGLLASSDPGLLERARDLRDYDGRTTPAVRFNFKMSDLQAALARTQVGRLPDFLAARRRLADRYDQAVPGLGLEPVRPHLGARPSWYRYLCRAAGDITGLLEHGERHGVHLRRPVPVPLDRLTGDRPLPQARLDWERLVSLPLHPGLTDEEQERVIAVLASAPVPGGRS